MTFLILLITVMTTGVESAGWSVTYGDRNPCALRGSSVKFRCSYDYPDGETVTNTTWSKGGLNDGKWIRTDVSKLSLYQNRVEYLGDRHHNCNLAIYDLRDNDTGHFYFRFDTHTYGWRSRGSLYLSVTGLTASVYPNSVSEGENVTLKCTTSCKLHRPSPIAWFRDGQPVANTEFQARVEDAGNYSCAIEVQGQEPTRSDPVALDIQYQNVSVELLPDMDTTEIIERKLMEVSVQSVILRVGFGVKALALLVLLLFMVWAWRQNSTMDKEECGLDYENINRSGVCRRDFISSASQHSGVIEEEITV
ncbi:B-cell receptor CD22-like [Polymixia lowei]